MNAKFLSRIGIGSLICALLGLCACGGASGSPSHGNSPTPTLVFSANTNTITAPQSVTLSWNATNASNVTITASTGSGSATRTVISSSLATGAQTDSPTQTTTYTAVATGSGGSSAPQTAVVQVAQPVPPQITFAASPLVVNGGQTTTLTWTTTNTTSVTITPPIPTTDDTGALSTSGSAIVPVLSTTTFTINATGPGGAAAPKSVTVQVPFTLTLNASPSTIITGQSTPVTLTWQVAGGTATSLSIDNGVCGSCVLPQGTSMVAPTTTTTYTATAIAADGSKITQSATVTVSSGSSTVIKHIFFLLQENRSFDMYFGLLGPYRTTRLSNAGIPDSQTINGFDPNVTLRNLHTGVHVKPFHELTECTENLSPAWDESHHDTTLTGGDSAWDNPPQPFTDSLFGMAGFLDTTGSVPQVHDPNGTRAMGYYDSTDLPYYYDLATFFATSDSWHSPILANTVPNRMYLMAGTSFGHEYPDFSSSHPKYAAPTIFHSMNAANVSWLYYYHDGIFLANFTDFQDPKIGPKTFPESDLIQRLQGKCGGISCDPDKALPEVIFIDSASGSSGLDEHPDNNVQKGAAYVKSIIDALMQSDAWQDSVFILTYDEGGGLYDHVPPFAVPPPDQIAPGQCPDLNNGSSGYCTVGQLGGQNNKIGAQQFGLTGFRVPLVVISPYAKPNYVSHTPRDYTAILAFIEETFNVPSLTARDAYWKDPTRDMSEFFDFTKPALTTAPGGAPWTTFLSAQPTSGTCDQTKEAGPTF